MNKEQLREKRLNSALELALGVEVYKETNKSVINEESARRNKENYSFSSYKAGSATSEYNQSVSEVATKIESAKANVSDEAKERLDKLLTSYSSKLANWTNKHNSNGAGHVSSMISGPANYNMRKHEKFLQREGKLWEEYNEINNIDHQISAIVHGDKIIKSGDSNVIEKLKEKLSKALEEHQEYKDYNLKARKEGTAPHAPYVLQNSNGRIKAIRDRLARLEREKSQEVKEESFGDIKIVDNTELSRVQIIFPNIPSKDIRTELKRFGFKWAPSQGAWQNYRNRTNLDNAKNIIQKAI